MTWLSNMLSHMRTHVQGWFIGDREAQGAVWTKDEKSTVHESPNVWRSNMDAISQRHTFIEDMAEEMPDDVRELQLR